MVTEHAAWRQSLRRRSANSLTENRRGILNGVPSAVASAARVVGSARRSSPLSIALSLVLPLLAVPALTRAAADHLADTIAAQLLSAAAPLSDNSPALSRDEPRDEDAILSETPALRAAVQQAERAPRGAHSAHASAAHGVHISAAQVLAVAARRAMPEAVPVKATAYHPAGLLLRGVSAWGVGLQDGDVLTEAAGQKASSVAQVVGIVLLARAHQSREISGRFYRAGVPFLLIVEQPYPPSSLPG
jgi:hypothetical protein